MEQRRPKPEPVHQSFVSTSLSLPLRFTLLLFRNTGAPDLVPSVDDTHCDISPKSKGSKALQYTQYTVVNIQASCSTIRHTFLVENLPPENQSHLETQGGCSIDCDPPKIQIQRKQRQQCAQRQAIKKRLGPDPCWKLQGGATLYDRLPGVTTEDLPKNTKTPSTGYRIKRASRHLAAACLRTGLEISPGSLCNSLAAIWRSLQHDEARDHSSWYVLLVGVHGVHGVSFISSPAAPATPPWLVPKWSWWPMARSLRLGAWETSPFGGSCVNLKFLRSVSHPVFSNPLCFL